MKNLKLNYFLTGLLFISFIAYFIILFLQPVKEPTFLNYAKIVPTVVTIDTALIFLFAKFFWKWRIFYDWLVPFPNLNGTYKGKIRTTWTDPETGGRPDVIDAVLTINQSFFSISCVMRTTEMTSYSILADFILDPDNQVKKLSYTYTSNPKQVVIERSPQHLGTAVFDIDDGKKKKHRLIGEYWTARKTTGSIEMEFWKKDKVNSLPTDFVTHPVSEIRDYKS